MRVGKGLGKRSIEKLAEYVGEKYSAIPSFLKKYGYDENEDYSIAYLLLDADVIIDRGLHTILRTAISVKKQSGSSVSPMMS